MVRGAGRRADGRYPGGIRSVHQDRVREVGRGRARHRNDSGVIMSTSPAAQYAFDNAAAQTPARFSALARIFDPGTVRHLSAIGVGEGWHCLEVGGGGGSIASW